MARRASNVRVSSPDRIWLVNVSGVGRIALGAVDNREEDPEQNPELDRIDVRCPGCRTASGLNWQGFSGRAVSGWLGVPPSEAKVNQTVRDLKFGIATLKYDLNLYLPAADKLRAERSHKRLTTSVPSAEACDRSLPTEPEPGLSAAVSFASPKFQANVTATYRHC